VIYSCVPENKELVPAEFIQPEQMTEILVDMHLAESTIMLNRTNDANSKRNIEIIKGVLKKHKVDADLYKASFDFYTANPDVFTKIYDVVIERLTERQAKENLMAKDSIARQD
jgi:hypothetical protein